MKQIRFQKILALILYALFAMKSFAEVRILVSNHSTNHLKTLAGIQYALSEKSEIIFLEEKPKDFLEKMLEPEHKYLAIGTQALAELRRSSPHSIFFTSLPYSKPLLKTNQGKICGFFTDISLVKLIHIAKETKPNLRSMTMFFSNSQGNLYSEMGPFLGMQEGIFFEPIFVSDPNSLEQELESRKSTIQALLLVPDPLFDRENFGLITTFGKKNGIPIFANFNSLTELGVGLSLDIDYYDLGLRTAAFLNDMNSKGSHCELGPFFFPENEFIKINRDFWKEAGLNLPTTILSRSELDDLNQTGIDLYSRGKKETALHVFRYILSKDSQNEKALEYINRISSEKYDSKILVYLKEAEQWKEAGKFWEASQIYTKILELNPNYPGIKEKQKEAIFLASEKKREEGYKNEKTGKPFLAISNYLDSLKIDPSNISAKTSMDNLRKSLRSKVSDMHEEGEGYYNSRNYKESILLYENILLVVPDDKKASEYLRLSKSKFEALQRLKNCKNDKLAPCPL